MTLSYARIAERAFNTPLAYHPGKAEAFVLGLGSRIAGTPVIITNGGEAVDHKAFSNGRPSAGILGDHYAQAYMDNNRTPFRVINGVAVICVEGTLIHKNNSIGSDGSGTQSYSGLRTQMEVALQSAAIKGVVFEFDSYGGEVAGLFETAKLLADLSKAKPTIAILTDFAYSAAYLLASQCRSIVMPRFGGAGSIGAIRLHMDYSQQLENEGVKATIIASGKHKADGNPYEPLDPELLVRLQAELDTIRDAFAEMVGKGRRGKLSKGQALKTEADGYTAKECIELGLADAIADPCEAFDAFIAEFKGK